MRLDHAAAVARGRVDTMHRRALVTLIGGLLLPVLLPVIPAVADEAARVKALIQAARSQIGVTTVYDPAYVTLAYPGGDVAPDRGVCTDVVIRAYRALGIDLQQLVHEDMRIAFRDYPKTWGLKAPDKNIDHRRVRNLQTLFKRKGYALNTPISPADWQPGDLVTQMLPGNLPHIGIVSDQRSASSGRLLVIHNIGAGTQIEDTLDTYEITGRYRFFPP